jgi:hypothetical protein
MEGSTSSIEPSIFHLTSLGWQPADFHKGGELVIKLLRYFFFFFLAFFFVTFFFAFFFAFFLAIICHLLLAD